MRASMRGGQERQGFEQSFLHVTLELAQTYQQRQAGGAGDARDRAPGLEDDLDPRAGSNGGVRNLGEGDPENDQNHQEIQDSLDHPGGNLAGERNAFLASDEVGAHRLAGPARTEPRR